MRAFAVVYVVIYAIKYDKRAAVSRAGKSGREKNTAMPQRPKNNPVRVWVVRQSVVGPRAAVHKTTRSSRAAGRGGRRKNTGTGIRRNNGGIFIFFFLGNDAQHFGVSNRSRIVITAEGDADRPDSVYVAREPFRT